MSDILRYGKRHINDLVQGPFELFKGHVILSCKRKAQRNSRYVNNLSLSYSDWQCKKGGDASGD